MKSIEDIEGEIEKNKVDRQKLLVEILKNPIHLDYLVDETINSRLYETEEDQISIKRSKGFAWILLLISTAIFVFAFVGPSASSNMKFFKSAFEPKLMPMIGLIIIASFPIIGLIQLIKRNDPVIIDKLGIQITRNRKILFDDIIYICFANQRHQNLNGFRLKFYFKDGKEELIDIIDFEGSHQKTRWVLNKFWLEYQEVNKTSI